MTDARAVVADPTWLPHRLTSARDAVTFVRLTRADHRAVTFLDDQYFAGRFPSQTLTVAELRKAMAPAGDITGLDFVFHSSMALSTLAARLFDIDGVSMGLKEPVILNQFANLSRTGSFDRPLLKLVLSLLARPLSPGERIIVKAGNVANRLIPEIMTAAPAARALLLHAPLDDFLRSIAKKGLPGRIAYRRLFRLLLDDFNIDGGFSDADLFEQTDLQIAALAWLNHHAQFARLLPEWRGRARSLSSRAFLADRIGTLRSIAEFLDLRVDPTALAQSTVFTQHSKELGRAFDANARAREYAAADAAYGEEIAMVARWGEAVARHVGVPMDLPERLGRQPT